MKKEDLAAIIYISILIIIWGSIGSLIDFPLLQANIYSAGSTGQILTFSISGLIFTLVGIKIYPIFINRISEKQ